MPSSARTSSRNDSNRHRGTSTANNSSLIQHGNAKRRRLSVSTKTTEEPADEAHTLELKREDQNVSAGGFFYERAKSRRERCRGAHMQSSDRDEAIPLGRSGIGAGAGGAKCGSASLVREALPSDDGEEHCRETMAEVGTSSKMRAAAAPAKRVPSLSGKQRGKTKRLLGSSGSSSSLIPQRMKVLTTDLMALSRRTSASSIAAAATTTSTLRRNSNKAVTRSNGNDSLTHSIRTGGNDIQLRKKVQVLANKRQKTT